MINSSNIMFLALVTFLLFAPSSSIPMATSDKCSAGFFYCHEEGPCIDARFRCDGNPDCPNAFDEINCTLGAAACDANMYQCNNTDICLIVFMKCDGVKDCPNGDDELDCREPNVACNGFLCKNYQCVPHSAKCDGKIDCFDSSDETNCSYHSNCESVRGFYPCASHGCLNHTQVCDGNKNCPHGDDEGPRCSMPQECNSQNCSHGCFQTPHGPHCFCMEGYELDSDEKTCKDIDECRTHNPCEHICENVQAGYVCRCKQGYDLKGKNKCVLKDPGGRLFISSRDEMHEKDHIRVIDLERGDSQGIASLLDSTHQCSIKNFDVDLQVEQLYYIHFCAKSIRQIHSINMDNLKSDKVIQSGLKQPEDIAVDWITHNLYIADSGLKQIIACDQHGTYCGSLVKDRAEAIKSIALDVHEAKMYWSDWDLKSIFESRMDGLSRRTLCEGDLAEPTGLSLDFSTRRLFWCDSKLNKIEYYCFLTRQRREFITLHFVPLAVTIFDRLMFVVEQQAGRIWEYDKFSADLQNLQSDRPFKELNAVKIHAYHPDIQKQGKDPCWNRPCSHLCLLAPNFNYSCVCPAHMKISHDGRHCVADSDQPFLFVVIGSQVFKLFFESIGQNVLVLTYKASSTITSFAYDWDNTTLFMFDPKHERIQAMNTKDESVGILKISPGRMDSLTFDPYTNNLYWLDNNDGILTVSSPNYDSSTQLLHDLGRPVSMALYQERSEIYISILGERPHILRTKMDGKDRTKLPIRVWKPTALFICKRHQRLYFADAGYKTIEFINLQSDSNLPLSKNTLLEDVGLVSSIAVHDDIIYWTSRDSNEMKYSKFGERNIYSIPFPVHPLEDKLVKPIVYASPESLKSECLRNKGGCSHICTIINKKVTCLCPHSYYLEDGHTCRRNQVTCTHNEFKCANGAACVLRDWLCDGNPDCDDASDERNCTEVCGPGSFRCKDAKCIPSHWRCDKSTDCADHSDEADCPSTSHLSNNCGPLQFDCGNGHCIPQSFVCDSGNDCANQADEKNCTHLCHNKDKHKCDSGKCVPRTWVCDGEDDCGDASDERDCPALKCQSNQFKCRSGACIDAKMKCDRFEDCNDRSDEEGCVYQSPTCAPNLFTCSDGHCIYKSELCDGFTDCSDRGDERVDQCNIGCLSDQVRCNNSTLCIPVRWLCNGHSDCSDGWDESLPQCTQPDIASTTSKPCKDGSFPCSSGDCVDHSVVCNNILDCLDGSDEGPRCETACIFDKGNCTQRCMALPSGSACACFDGYQLGPDRRTCMDVDECGTVGLCSHYCHNHPGNFTCSCEPGYKLAPDKRKCKANEASTALLLYMLPNAIRSIQLHDHSEHEIVKINSLSMKGMDYDFKSRTIFWTDIEQGTINSVGYAGQKVQVSVGGLDRPTHLSWDYIGRKFYFVASDTNINVCDESGTHCGLVLATRYLKIDGFVTFSKKRIMFWSVWTSSYSASDGRIESADMDGKRRRSIISYNLNSPTGLTVDPVLDTIYWVDTRLQLLYSADFDGRGIHRILDYSLVRPLSVAVFEDFIFWSNTGSDTLMKCNKFTGNARLTIHRGHVKAHAIRIYHPVIQPLDSNPCEHSNCHHLCLISPSGYSCTCSHGFTLAPDNRTCLTDKLAKSAVSHTICDRNTCKNGGSCVGLDGHRWECKCKEHYSGFTCENLALSQHSGSRGTSFWLVMMIMAVFFAIFGSVAYIIYWVSGPYGPYGGSIFRKGRKKIVVSYKNPVFAEHLTNPACEDENCNSTTEAMLPQSEKVKPTGFSNPLFGHIVDDGDTRVFIKV